MHALGCKPGLLQPVAKQLPTPHSPPTPWYQDLRQDAEAAFPDLAGKSDAVIAAVDEVLQEAITLFGDSLGDWDPDDDLLLADGGDDDDPAGAEDAARLQQQLDAPPLSGCRVTLRQYIYVMLSEKLNGNGKDTQWDRLLRFNSDLVAPAGNNLPPSMHLARKAFVVPSPGDVAIHICPACQRWAYDPIPATQAAYRCGEA